MRSVEEDLTTKARIRDAAVRRFATDGLDAPLRTIAADVDVSPGLIMHHFGSRAGLREACDSYVLAETRNSKSALLTRGSSPGALLAQLAQAEDYAPLVAYVLRCLQAGGALTSQFIDSMVAETHAYLEEAVAEGTVSPSRDPKGRARVLVEMSLGSLLLQLPARQERLDLAELPRWLRSYLDRVLLPVLEFQTVPVLTDSTLLDTYLASTDRSKQ